MPKRKEKLHQISLKNLLVEAGMFRGRLHDYQDRLTPFQGDYNKIAKLRSAIDLLVEELTGDPEFYSAKPHSR